jgi:hypothetical protein
MQDFQQALFNLDNQQAELRFTFSDQTPVWPILRWQIRIAAMHVQPKTGKSQSSAKPISLISYMLFCHRKRPRANRRVDILTIANYEGNPEVPNRMTLFLRELPELSRQEWLYSGQRRIFDNLPDTYSFDYWFFKAWMRSKLAFNTTDQKWEEKLAGFLTEIRETLNPLIKQGEWERIKSELCFINRIIPYYRKTLKKALKQASPKCILVSEGNNGEWKQAVLFQVAKELGIPTAEVQHGVFNLGMKYGPKLAASPALKAMKSDYELVFGPYHAGLTNAPVQCIPFGHYDLEQAVRQLKNKAVEKIGKEIQITLVGEGIPPSAVDNGLLKYTLLALQQWKQPFRLCIRLHPSEQPDAKYDPFFQFEGTRYSTHKEESIYNVINHSDILISHASTVVFEALYFHKPVCVLRDSNTEMYVPEGVGNPFVDSDSLLKLLIKLSEDTGAATAEGNEYWSTDGVANNFRHFYKNHIAG